MNVHMQEYDNLLIKLTKLLNDIPIMSIMRQPFFWGGGEGKYTHIHTHRKKYIYTKKSWTILFQEKILEKWVYYKSIIMKQPHI